jgi:hypothetical protein
MRIWAVILPTRSRLFERGIAIDPGGGNSYVGLGWIALREGHRDRARAYLQQARAIDPQSGDDSRARGGAAVKVAVDAQLAVGTATGIGEYVRGLIDALRAEGFDVIELSEPKLDPWRFDRRVFWDQVLLPQRVRQVAADVVHCASGTVPIGLSVPYVVTVHDVAWLRVQSHARPYARYYFGRFSMDRYRGAAAIAVDSAFSRDELLAVMPELDPAIVRVVYPGVASDYCALDRRGGDGRTILAIGTVERRKNLEALIETLPFLERRDWSRSGRTPRIRTSAMGIAQLARRGGARGISRLRAARRSAGIVRARRGRSRCRRSTKVSVTQRRRRCAPACRQSCRIRPRCRRSSATARASCRRPT